VPQERSFSVQHGPWSTTKSQHTGSSLMAGRSLGGPYRRALQAHGHDLADNEQLGEES